MADEAGPRARGLIDLDDALVTVLQHLDLASIAQVAQACKALRRAADDDALWRLVALRTYPKETVHLQSYPSYKDLVRDDNARHATLWQPLGSGVACSYALNSAPRRFFQAQLLGVEWDRAAGVLRVLLDARGERDLRPPSQSSLGLMVARCVGDDAPALRALHGLDAHNQALLGAAMDAAAAGRQAEGERLLERAVVGSAHVARLRRARPPRRFADLLAVHRPLRWVPLVERPGHYKGALEFDAAEVAGDVDGMGALLPESYASRREALAHGVDLVFCYANPLPVGPHDGMVDYTAVCLARAPPGGTLAGALRCAAPRAGDAAARYALPGGPLRAARGESAAAAAARWGHLHGDLLRRAAAGGWGGGE